MNNSNSGKSFLNSDGAVAYAARHSLRLTEAQQALQALTLTLPQHRMLGAPECLQLTANLMRTINARRVLDVGVFTGASSLSAALALPPGGEVHALDVSKEFTDMGRPFFEQAGVSDKIKIHIAPALETLDRFISEGQNGSFDFAFIDADKENYINYYERCLLLIRKGGIIAVDNTLWSGKVLEDTTDPSTRAIQAFNVKVKDDERVNISFLTVGDGLTLLFIK